MYLPDTNACIALIKGSSALLSKEWRRHPANSVFICAVVEAELRFGAANSHPNKQMVNTVTLNNFLIPYTKIDFDSRCARWYGSLRAKLKRNGTPIGPMDMMIAATALAHNLIVVMHNTAEFAKVEGLRLEDWEIVL